MAIMFFRSQAQIPPRANAMSTPIAIQCTLHNNTDFWGADIAVVESVPSAYSCCGTCSHHSGCFRWTFAPTHQRCFLKRETGWIKKVDVNRMSGTVLRATGSPPVSKPPPSPVPQPQPKVSPTPSTSPQTRPPPPSSHAASPSPTHAPLPAHTPIPADGKFVRAHYAEVLNLCGLFFEAQRSGVLPATNRVAWRRSAHLTDAVPGGLYDAGDYLKLNFPLASSVALLAWGMLDFADGYQQSGQAGYALNNLHTGVDYLLRSHIAPRKYIAQIGNPDIDHNYWGRADQENTARPAYVYDDTMNASDLMGKVSAALAASSIVFRGVNATYAAELLSHAEDLWQWGSQMGKGKYSDYYTSATKSIYESTATADDMAWGATWLYKASGQQAYLDAAVKYWKTSQWDITTDWDNSAMAAAVVLANLAAEGHAVPDPSAITSFVNDFVKAWVGSNGYLEIIKTPKGMSFPRWSKWGNLQLSTTAAFLALSHAKHSQSSAQRAATVAWARSQADYAMGSSGRSFIVGFGNNAPTHCHHAGASCPAYPARCDWANFDSPNPNPQVLYGALVGGPSGPGDDTYYDKRTDYVTNEVAIDYNAGLAGALAALVEMI